MYTLDYRNRWDTKTRDNIR